MAPEQIGARWISMLGRCLGLGRRYCTTCSPGSRFFRRPRVRRSRDDPCGFSGSGDGASYRRSGGARASSCAVSRKIVASVSRRWSGLAVALEAYASPDLQTSVNHIVRTLVKSTRPPPLPHAMGTIQAMVHVPRPPSNPPAAATPPAVPAGTPVPGSVSRHEPELASGMLRATGRASSFRKRCWSARCRSSRSGSPRCSAVCSPRAARRPLLPRLRTSRPPQLCRKLRSLNLLPLTEPPAPAAKRYCSAAPASSAAAPRQQRPCSGSARAGRAPAPARPAPARAPAARAAAPPQKQKNPAPERRASAPAAPAPEKRASAEDLFDDTR